MAIVLDGNKTVNLPEVVIEIIQTIVKKFRPKKVILFGSYATGTAEANSDIDLLVVVDADKKDWRDISVKIRVALNAFDISKDIIVVNQSTLEQRANDWWSIYCSALKEGVVVYEE